MPNPLYSYNIYVLVAFLHICWLCSDQTPHRAHDKCVFKYATCERIKTHTHTHIWFVCHFQVINHHKHDVVRRNIVVLLRQRSLHIYSI